MHSKRKFLLLPLTQQHKKCAEALRQSDFATYDHFQTWLELPPLEKTHEALSNRYHYHLLNAHQQVKEHRLLVEQGDKETGEEPWPIAIYLDHLRSAHNVGSIVRTTEALSLGTLYFSPQTPTLLHPQVQKTAMGADKWVRGYDCDDIDQLPRPLIALETAATAISIYDFSFPKSFTLALGNEEYGLSSEVLKKADTLIRIPMRGRKNSLNVANAFAIAASEIQRQTVVHL